MLLLCSGNTADDQIAIKTAEKLLLEVKPCSPVSEQKVRQLECYILLSYHVKANTEKALEKLMTMASTNVREGGREEGREEGREGGREGGEGRGGEGRKGGREGGMERELHHT